MSPSHDADNSPPGTGFHARILNAVHSHAMFVPGQTVVAAVSGGPDSMALLHALHALRQDLEIQLVAAHLDHGLRGEDSGADAEFVAQAAADLGLPAEIGTADVRGRAARLHESVEEAAREARHSFLIETARRYGADRIALGHTRDDCIETVLLNIIRGSGVSGLAGIPPVRLPFVRPLCDLTRDDVEAYCGEHGLTPRQDVTNTDVRYLRNRVRAELLPLLRSYYNPRIDDSLIRLASIAGADEEVLQRLTSTEMERMVRFAAFSATIRGVDLQPLLPGVQRRVVREALAHVRGSTRDVGAQVIDAAIAGAISGGNGSVTLPCGGERNVAIRWAHGEMHIEAILPPSSPLPWRRELAVPGVTAVSHAGSVICVERYDTLSAAITGMQSCDGFQIALPEETVIAPLAVRSWRHGDRIRLFGMEGSRKLQDLFVDAKIPADHRHRTPVLIDGNDEPLAVLGLRCGRGAVRIDGAWSRRCTCLEWNGVLTVCYNKGTF